VFYEFYCYFAVTVKYFIDQFYEYLSVNMDGDLVLQMMVSQQQIPIEDAVMTVAQSCYQKTCLILERARVMDLQALIAFCKMLQRIESQRSIGNLLTKGLIYNSSMKVHSTKKDGWQTV